MDAMERQGETEGTDQQNSVDRREARDAPPHRVLYSALFPRPSSARAVTVVFGHHREGTTVDLLNGTMRVHQRDGPCRRWAAAAPFVFYCKRRRCARRRGETEENEEPRVFSQLLYEFVFTPADSVRPYKINDHNSLAH